ncbi:MAG TPA: DUF2585 family protein [Flavobacteriales bacterium]|nr:DUF2585 family protein [Flavobacteriales bacterium]
MKKIQIPLLFTALLVLTALQLHNQGRLWTAESGHIYFWVGNAYGPDNSQHIFDPYSFSHMLHGVLFFFLLRKIFKKAHFGWILFGSAFLEAGWELLENSPLIINRYREGTAALGYAGDTVLNSMADILSCCIGTFIAFKIGGKLSIALFFATEIIMVLWIRDCLTLNVLMLIYPVDAIKVWQMH